MFRSASVTQLGFIKPEIPTLAPEPPTGDGWIEPSHAPAEIGPDHIAGWSMLAPTWAVRLP
jgi:hypothetical protein